MSGGLAEKLVERPSSTDTSRNLKDLFGTEYSIIPRGIERLPETVLSSPAKRILGFYCRLPGPRWESVSTIERETGLSRPTVTKSRTLLVEYGLLIQLPQHKAYGNPSNCYEVNYELVKQLNQESSFTSLDAFKSCLSSFTDLGKAPLPKKNQGKEDLKEQEECPVPPQELVNGGVAANPSDDLPPETETLAHLLFDLHRDNWDAKYKPNEHQIQSWRKDIDKLNRIDGRSWDEIERVIRYVKTMPVRNGFTWATNIMSGSKLREKFPKLIVESNRPKGGEALPATPEPKPILISTNSDPVSSPEVKEESPVDYDYEAFIGEVKGIHPAFSGNATIIALFSALCVGGAARPGIGRAMAKAVGSPGEFVFLFRNDPLATEPVRAFLAAMKAKEREREKAEIQQKLQAEHEARLQVACPICGGPREAKLGFPLMETCADCGFQTGQSGDTSDVAEGFAEILALPFSERLAAYQEREAERAAQISSMISQFRGLASA